MWFALDANTTETECMACILDDQAMSPLVRRASGAGNERLGSAIDDRVMHFDQDR
jgi:hypothetical protein